MGEKSKVDFISTLKFEEKEQVNAIILAQQNKLKLFVDENVGKLKTTNSYIGDSFAFSDGVDKGSNISLSKGLNKENGNFVKTDQISVIKNLVQYVSKSRPEITSLIIDDFSYMLSNEYFRRIKETGFNY